MYKLNGTTNKTGLGITLKVMAGDVLDIHGKSYWANANTGGSGVNLAPAVLDLLNGMLGSPSASVINSHTTATELNGITGINTPIGNFIGEPGRDDDAYPTRPKAFINYLFLDEQFRYAGGGTSPVENTGGLKDHFSELQGLVAPKNGYVYIYVSNESPVDVFFDNLQVVHTRGPVLEETHYYPFGLTMSGISSKALAFGSPENKRKFNKGSELQNKEFSDGSGLEWYATPLRSLDPQVGRWWQIDSKPDYAQSLYSAMSNNPLLHNDPLGDTLVFPGASGRFIQTTATTIGNIVNSGAGKALGELLTSTENIQIVELTGQAVSKYNPNTKTLSWNPKLGIVTTNGEKLSPASVLNHEADHAADAIKDPTGHSTRANTPDPNYSNAEEKRVIQGSEQATSFLLGETKQGQVTRTDHSAAAILITNDPMSTNGQVINLPGRSITLPPVIIQSRPRPRKNENHEYE